MGVLGILFSQEGPAVFGRTPHHLGDRQGRFCLVGLSAPVARRRIPSPREVSAFATLLVAKGASVSSVGAVPPGMSDLLTMRTSALHHHVSTTHARFSCAPRMSTVYISSTRTASTFQRMRCFRFFDPPVVPFLTSTPS